MKSDPAARPQKRFHAGFAAIGMMYNQGVTALYGILIGRIVGAADYGVANIAKNLFQIVVILTPLGLDLALQRYMASGVGTLDDRFAVLTKLRQLAVIFAVLPLVILSVGLAPWLAEHVYPFENFAAVLLVSFAALPFATDASVTGGAYRGLRDPAPAVMATYLLLPSARVLITIGLFLIGWRLWAIIVATTAAQILSWLYLYVRARRDFPKTDPGSVGSWQTVPSVLSYSWAMCISLVVAMLNKSVDVLMLAHYRPPVEVGRYVAVQLLVSLLTIFSIALGQTLGSSIAELYSQGDRAGIERLLIDNMRRVALAVAPLFAVIIFWGDRLDLILGSSFVIDLSVVRLLAANQLLIAIFAYTGYGLSMTGRHRLEALILCSGLVISIVLCSIFVPRFGAEGAATATLIAAGLASLAQFHFTRTKLAIRIFRWRIFLPIAAALAIAAFVRSISAPFDPRTFVSTAALGIIVLLVYAVLAVALLLPAEERQSVMLRFRRRSSTP